MKSLSLTAALGLVLAPPAAFSGSPPKQPSAGELLLNIERLSVVGNVLYVAAHPDDENTRLLAYLANEKLLRTAYLSVTRGEGGQNLIGPEQGALLGLIRTQELLAARRIDGAEQFFTRARDFGYSKSADETLSIWGRDAVLADIVWVIRTFKPDLIISRFPPQGGETHGQHTASALLTVEAFRAAADPAFHPEQVKLAGTWQAKRLLWNRGFFNAPPSGELSGLIKMDVGAYNALLGVSYGEMAAASRSMHKSQGFGAAPSRGPAFEYFELLAGEAARETIFDGLDLTWARVAGSANVARLVRSAREHFKPTSPHEVIPELLEAYGELQRLPGNPWKEQKQREIINAIIASGGVWTNATASDFNVVPGGDVKVTAVALNRSPAAIRVREIRFSDGSAVSMGKSLSPNQPLQTEQTLHISPGTAFSNPYWLTEAPDPGTFRVRDATLIGLPEESAPLRAEFVFSAGPHSFSVVRPISYKWTDPVEGERYRPAIIVPPLTINPEVSVLMFPDAKPKLLRVSVKSGKAGVTATLRPELPSHWRASPPAISLKLDKKGEEQEVTFEINPPTENPGQSSNGMARLVAEVDGKKLSKAYQQVDHSHIPIQTLFPEAQVKLVRFDLQRSKTNVGYIPGAGDEIPSALRQVGYQVTILVDELLRNQPLGAYDAIVVGVRAYNTNGRLPFYHRKLMDYVSAGGTIVVQYNTNNRLSRLPADIGPYPFEISQDRVTDEKASVIFDLPNHPVVQKPNKLGEHDFDGWVQERGLYFAGKWSDRYEAVLSMNDPGEPPKKGSLLVTKYGKGAFIYTGLAFFRQLPAGVPGAYRFFANLIAYGK
jgi:LmbE family N-acetylglucosaminyl deacetylase